MTIKEKVFTDLFLLYAKSQDFTKESAFKLAYEEACFAQSEYENQESEKVRERNDNSPSPYIDTSTYIEKA